MSQSQLDRQIKSVEITIQQAEKAIALGEAQQRLLAGTERPGDYKLVWVESFIKDGARKAVIGKANPALQSEEHQKAFVKDIDAIGAVAMHSDMIVAEGVQLRRQLEADQDTLTALNAESLV